jgi:hypothetical protein
MVVYLQYWKIKMCFVNVLKKHGLESFFISHIESNYNIIMLNIVHSHNCWLIHVCLQNRRGKLVVNALHVMEI